MSYAHHAMHGEPMGTRARYGRSRRCGSSGSAASSATLGKPISLAQFQSLRLGEPPARVTKQFGHPESRQNVVGSDSHTRSQKGSTASTTADDIPIAAIRGTAATRSSSAFKHRGSGTSGHTSRPGPDRVVLAGRQTGAPGLLVKPLWSAMSGRAPTCLACRAREAFSATCMRYRGASEAGLANALARAALQLPRH